MCIPRFPRCNPASLLTCSNVISQGRKPEKSRDLPRSHSWERSEPRSEPLQDRAAGFGVHILHCTETQGLPALSSGAETCYLQR